MIDKDERKGHSRRSSSAAKSSCTSLVFQGPASSKGPSRCCSWVRKDNQPKATAFSESWKIKLAYLIVPSWRTSFGLVVKANQNKHLVFVFPGEGTLVQHIPTPFWRHKEMDHFSNCLDFQTRTRGCWKFCMASAMLPAGSLDA